MFANRRSSQKPDEDFYAAFKQNFPGVGTGTTTAAQGQTIAAPTHHRSASVTEAIVEPPTINRPVDSVEDTTKEQDATPKPFADQWRLTPSLMDPNSFAFSAFANQPPGYYTPTPGGFNTFYHSSAAGDLHTPGMMGLNTPLSLPHSLHALQAGDPGMQFPHFNPQMLHHAQTFQDHFSHHQQNQTQQLFAPPSHFLQHQDSGYSGMDDSSHKATPQQDFMQGPQPGTQPFDNALVPTGLPSAEKFRFHTTLNAPTAMVRNTEEIPITYLNKGQAYTMSIYDTAPPAPHPGVVLRYRTYVRVSFEDEQQRAKPGSCWQLWKEGRGTNEAHQRGGKLLAVEHVDPNQGGDEELRKSQIELEKASFDGFAVTWYPNHRATGQADCSISVRFNFLSTDFSHSKGVKGIPVRLCAKTELLTAVHSPSANEPEVCFSKVKLFRDHGAERKLSNDVAHVKKSIEKLKQQISQAESGIGNVGKRKRSGSMATKEGGKLTAEEDLHMKLASLQDMFSSTRPASILFLKGEPEDDPDLFPVKLPGGEEIKAVTRTETWTSRQSGSESPGSNVSPTPSSASLTPKRKFSEMNDIANESAVQEESLSPSRPVKIQKTEHEPGKPEVFALDVDINYKPPTNDRPIRPVACFYVKQKDAEHGYYRAVYLFQRTVQDLISGIAEKFHIDSHRITKVTHVNSRGLHIIVDEEVVRELPEGQDMVVEFTSLRSNESIKNEFETSEIGGVIVDGDASATISTADAAISDALEMWLNY